MSLYRILVGLMLGLVLSTPAQATIVLFDRAYQLDGAFTGFETEGFSGGLPGTLGIDETGLNTMTGIGSVTATIGGAGVHSFDMFVDHDIDSAVNTFFNEDAEAVGAPAAEASWEIDEPGFVDGDIGINIAASTLDNGRGTSIFGATGFPDDVSLALGFDFVLAAGETATIVLTLAETMPSMGFFLRHFDAESSDEIFFSAALNIAAEPPVGVPEPGTLALLILGLIGVSARGFRVNRTNAA